MTIIRSLFFAVPILAAWSAPANAQSVTQTFQYDANGRLTTVTTTGPAGTNTATYAYDDADNRTSRSQTGAVYAAVEAPDASERMKPEQQLASQNERIRVDGSSSATAAVPPRSDPNGDNPG